MQRKLRKSFRGNRFQKLPKSRLPRFCIPRGGTIGCCHSTRKLFATPLSKIFGHPTLKNILPPHPLTLFCYPSSKGIVCHPTPTICLPPQPSKTFLPAISPKNLCHLTPKTVVIHSDPKFPCLTFNFCGWELISCEIIFCISYDKTSQNFK